MEFETILVDNAAQVCVIACRGSRNIKVFTSINQVVIFVELVLDGNMPPQDFNPYAFADITPQPQQVPVVE